MSSNYSFSSLVGDHGYDNSLPSMHPFLAAAGPSFRRGYRLKSLQSVDIYPLMCHLLSVPPRHNNGTLTQARCLLATESCGDVAMVTALVVGVLFILATITGKSLTVLCALMCLFIFVFLTNSFSTCVRSGVFWLLRSRRSMGPRAFQRLQVDYDDDDDPLLE